MVKVKNMNPSRHTSVLPASAARDLGRLSDAMQALAFELPPRTSLRQVMAFTAVAEAHALGHTITMAELREAVGADRSKAPMLGPSVERSFGIFLEPTKRDPDALGWVYQEGDEDDRRRKHLRLTPAGIEAARHILEALTA
jgi:hypothetical protein